jgi:hypothetical protein
LLAKVAVSWEPIDRNNPVPYLNGAAQPMQEVETAMNALKVKNDENAKASNRDEFLVTDRTRYVRWTIF